MPASQAGEAGSIPVICFLLKKIRFLHSDSRCAAVCFRSLVSKKIPDILVKFCFVGKGVFVCFMSGDSIVSRHQCPRLRLLGCSGMKRGDKNGVDILRQL